MSVVTLSRTWFSGNTRRLRVMPGCDDSKSPLSCSRVFICGLPTMATLTVPVTPPAAGLAAGAVVAPGAAAGAWVAAAGGDAAGAHAAPNRLTSATMRAADDQK